MATELARHMGRSRFVVSAAMTACLALLATFSRAEPSTLDEAAQLKALPDETIDAFLFQDQYGVKGSGERARFLARLNPSLFAEQRRLRRRLHFARPEDRAAVTSELMDFYNDIGNWMGSELQRAPLDAMDAMLAQQRDDFPLIERTHPRLCSADVGSEEAALLETRKVLPDVTAAFDLASYRAVAAARDRPTLYPRLDESDALSFFEELPAAGLSEADMAAVFVGANGSGLAPADRCALSRRVLDAIAALPAQLRGPLLMANYSDGDGEDR